MARGDDDELTRVDRRRLLSGLGALGLTGFAGCSGGDDGSTTAPGHTTTDTGTMSSPGTTIATTAPTTSNPDPPAATFAPIDDLGDVQTHAGMELTVAKDGSGDFETVGAAIDAAPRQDPDGAIIRIGPGTYKEKLKISPRKPNLTMVGAGATETILTYDDNQESVGGTFDTGSVTVFADNFTAHNITFRNNFGLDDQAVAMYAGGDNAVFGNCRFMGNMDTLLTEGGGNRQYFRRCEIAGTTDFIFGGATAIFDNCKIICRETAEYIAAAATPPSEEFGYVFRNCDVVGPETPEGEVVLGRPWKEGARTVYLNSYLGDQIEAKGWDNWGDRADTAFFAEYANTGPGYTPDERVEWSHQLTDEEAEAYTRSNIFDGWNPQVSILGSDQPILSSGQTNALRGTLRNLSAEPLSDVAVSMAPPNDEWGVSAASETSFDTLRAQGSRAVTWDVTVPAGIRGQYELPITSNYEDLTTTKQVLAFDTSGNSAPLPYAINNGSEEVIVDGELIYLPMLHPRERNYVFSGANFGIVAAPTSPIGGTELDTLYQTAHVGTDLYLDLGLASGTYDITLHFAELEHDATGERVFDVSAGGETMIQDLDLVERAGAFTAHTETLAGIEHNGGRLTLGTTSHTGETLISGFVVRSA